MGRMAEFLMVVAVVGVAGVVATAGRPRTEASMMQGSRHSTAALTANSTCAAAKAELIAALAQPDESCHLSSGIGDKVPFGEGYKSVRGR